MAACTRIPDLDTVLKLPKGCHISDVTLCPLTEATGVSFSSSLKRLRVTWQSKYSKSISNDEISMETEHGKREQVEAEARSSDDSSNADPSRESGELILVAKFMPDPAVWVSLNSEATFEKELNMYSLMVPVYLDVLDRLIVQEKSNQGGHYRPDLPLFPQYYGGRLNLENRADKVDGDALILLENLSLRGYENCRKSKLNGPEFSLVLEKLALFHSVGIIIRQDPTYKDAFQNLLKTTRPFFFGAKEKNIEKINAERRNRIMTVVEGFVYTKDVNERLLDVLVKTDAKTLPSAPTCYYSLIHNDLWINNIMFKYSNEDTVEKNAEQLIDVKFIDFQNTNFGSVAKEFAFLVYTSVDWSLWNKLESYISHYHACLVGHLKKYFFSKNNSEDFISQYSLDRFKTELKNYTNHKLKHIFIIMKIVYGKDDRLYETNLKHILDHCVQNGFI